jgi:hypothetical protein
MGGNDLTQRNGTRQLKKKKKTTTPKLTPTIQRQFKKGRRSNTKGGAKIVGNA